MKTKKKKLKERSWKLKNQKNMIDFNLVRKEPSGLELRAYLHQIIKDNFGLSENMRELIQNQFPQADNKCDLNAISEPDIRKILQDELLLPEEIFFFKKVYDPELITEGDYKSIPDIFTRICQVSFDKGGLIIMERHNSQIYELYDSKGKYLIGPCHDLELGTDGKVMLRTSESIFWEMMQYNGEGLEDNEIYGPFDSPSDFPNIGSRYLIPEMLPIGSYSEPESDQLKTLTEEEVINKLENDYMAYKSLVKYYHDNEELAVKAVSSNLFAFTLLSEKLRGNKGFVVKLISQRIENQNLYSYLDDTLKTDIEIVRLCIRANPLIIRNIAPVSDRDLMQEALKDHIYNLEYASDDLKADKKLVLGLVRNNWPVLREASKDLLSDSSFIAEAIHCFNDEQEEDKTFEENPDDLPFGNSKKETIDMIEVISYLVSCYPRVLKHIAPATDMKIISRCLEYTHEPDISFIIDCISEDLRKTKEFWTTAVSKSLYMLKNAPLMFKQDKDVVLSAVRYHGELVEFANESLKGDPDVFLAAISQIKNRRGVCNHEEIMHLMPEKFKSDKDFLLKAIDDYPWIFKHVPIDIRSDREFMLEVIKKTYGWIIEYAAPGLQSDRQFIVEAAILNQDILRWLPKNFKDDQELIEMLRKEGIEPDITFSDDLPF